jgi:hypothetical protein
VIAPKLVDGPYSNVNTVCDPLGLTNPCSTPDVLVAPVAACVTAMGAVSDPPAVVKLRTAAIASPAALDATQR